MITKDEMSWCLVKFFQLVPKEKYGEPLGEHTCQHWGLKGLRGHGKSCLGPLSLSWTSCLLYHEVEGDRGAGNREKRGREVYGRREKRGWEAGFPRWWEAGEKGKNYTTLHNISYFKKMLRGREPTNTGWEPGLKGTGSGRFKPPVLPPPHEVC